MVDHRGRPLTEVYFTVMKRNAGHKEWYENNNFTGDTIEFSHCFGKVTGGLDLPNEEYHYNIRKLHNVDITKIPNYTDIFSKIYINSGIPETVEDEITYETSYMGEDGTIGDLVEYNPVDDDEIVLDVVSHRFNTAQRETLNKEYSAITYDEMVADDYDFSTNGSTTYDGKIKGFTITPVEINKSNRVEGEQIQSLVSPGNICLEGYFYNPYTRIKIRELSDTVNKVIGRIIRITGSRKVSNNVLEITTTIDYGLIKNDTLCFYNNETKQTFWGTIMCVEDNLITIYLEDTNIFNKNTNSIVSTNEGVPSYATFLPNSHSFVWRNIVKMSELKNTSDLLNMPFSNGRIYIEKNVNFFLKRQDPKGEYGVFKYDVDANYKNTLNIYKIKGWSSLDFSSVLYNNGLLEICY